jgi:cyclopropane fatty-acyl-phospholipid synthase-like methyltransferase
MTLSLFRTRKTAPIVLQSGRASLTRPVSQSCTRSQMDEAAYHYWCREIREPARRHRKQWEFCYIAQVLALAGKLAPGQRGLGFGVGEEPLAALFAARGAQVVATDLEPAAAAQTGWIETRQHAHSKAMLNQRYICPPDAFEENVEFRSVDMNHIPRNLGYFDFIWSACAFEHLGSIERGGAFLRNTARMLAPGGIAVHTTELNCFSNSETLDYADTVLFRRCDLEQFGSELADLGCAVEFNFDLGELPSDHYVDVPPYTANEHLKLQVDQWVTTSFGIAFTRSAD